MPSIIQHTNGNLYSLVEDDQGWCSTEVQRTMHARMCVHTHTLNPTTLGAMTAGKLIVERGDLNLRGKIYVHICNFICTIIKTGAF